MLVKVGNQSTIAWQLVPSDKMSDVDITEQNGKMNQTVNIELDDMTAIFDTEFATDHEKDEQKRAGTVVEAKPSSDLLDGLNFEQEDPDNMLI